MTSEVCCEQIEEILEMEELEAISESHQIDESQDELPAHLVNQLIEEAIADRQMYDSIITNMIDSAVCTPMIRDLVYSISDQAVEVWHKQQSKIITELSEDISQFIEKIVIRDMIKEASIKASVVAKKPAKSITPTKKKEVSLFSVKPAKVVNTTITPNRNSVASPRDR